MKLAVFDLDHTLLPIDTGDGWTVFLIEKAGLGEEFLETSRRLNREYHAGTFSLDEMMSFAMGLLARYPRRMLEAWRDEFVREKVAPHVDPVVLHYLDQWRERGCTLVLATGTHRFVTEPASSRSPSRSSLGSNISLRRRPKPTPRANSPAASRDRTAIKRGR